MTTTAIDEGKKLAETLVHERATTTQIRKFLSAVNSIESQIPMNNNEHADKMSDDLADQVQYLRIKLAYQAGREQKLKFLQEKLDPQILAIGNKKKEFIQFARLIESMVAYHKFYGGRDN